MDALVMHPPEGSRTGLRWMLARFAGALRSLLAPLLGQARGAAPLLLAALVGAAPSTAAAQAVSGVVVEEETGSAVPAAFVQLMDDSGSVRAAFLTDSGGYFMLRAPRPGRYRLRVERIGFENLTTSPIELRSGASRYERIRVPRSPVNLGAIDVSARHRCHLDPRAGKEVFRIWTEARKSLELAAWSVGAGRSAMDYTVARFDRVLELHSRVWRQNREWVESGTGERPFAALPEDRLLRGGFVQSGAAGFTYYGPDAQTLLSDGFVESHCFSLRRGANGKIGLAFEPAPGVTRPEIRGVVWLDSATALLRRTDFQYTGTPFASDVGAGGSITYERRPDGRLIIARWILRAPMLRIAEDLGGPGVRYWPAGVVERGGRILAIHGQATMATRGEVAGTVYDRAHAMALAGARVYLSGTPFATVTDSAGRFLLEGVPPGTYTLATYKSEPDTLLAVRDSVVVGQGTSRVRLLAVRPESFRGWRAAAGAGSEGDSSRRVLPAASRAPANPARAAYDSARAVLSRQAPGSVSANPGAPDVRQRPAATSVDSAALTQLRRALHLDPGYAAAALLLGELALIRHDSAAATSAAAALRGVILRSAETADVWTRLAEVQVFLGNGELAQGAALAALDEEPDDPAALHALAAALLASEGNELAGADAYMRGLDHIGADWLTYSRDAAPLFSPEELRSWKQARDSGSLGQWLKRFWSLRAARAALPLWTVLAAREGSPFSPHGEQPGAAHGAGRAPSQAAWLDTLAAAPGDGALQCDVLSFRGTGDGEQVTAAIAIASRQLTAQAVADGVLYRPHITFSLFDTTSGRAVILDTIFVVHAQRPLGRGDYLITFVQLPFAPGPALFRVRLRDQSGSGAAILHGGAIEIPDLARGLALSAIAISRASASSRWRRGRIRLDLVPVRVFRGGTFSLYYEIYGLRPGAEYRAHTRILPVKRPGVLQRIRDYFRVGARSIDVTDDERAQPSSEGAIQTLRQFRPLLPGRYRVTVVVTDLATGARATRERLLEVR